METAFNFVDKSVYVKAIQISTHAVFKRKHLKIFQLFSCEVVLKKVEIATNTNLNSFHSRSPFHVVSFPHSLLPNPGSKGFL